MSKIPMEDEKRLLSEVPSDGKSIGNKSLRERLRWSKERYWLVRNSVVASGMLRLGGGRGGSVVRVSDRDEQLVLANIPPDGTSIGNMTLRAKLGWAEDKYWTIRNALIERGELMRSGGKGGGVRRALDAESDESADKDPEVELAEEAAQYKREHDLYEPIAAVLRRGWAKDRGLGDFVVEVTAYAGRRETGGKWSRPDITVVSERKFKWTQESVFDVITFEVKLGAGDITAVYEAQAHGRCATYSYVFLVTELAEAMKPLKAEAQRHGIGVIVSSRPESYDEWDTIVEAVRRPPDPHSIEEFVAVQLSEEARSDIHQWRNSAR
jgi:hypothetical protein